MNPRLVEPGNAWRSGVDLVGAMVAIARGDHPDMQPPGESGVSTHQLLLAILGRAQHGSGRAGVAHEILAAVTHTGSYRESEEELTPIRGDLRAAIPVVMATAATLVRPATWRWFASGSVAGYTLTPEGWDAILAGSTPAP